MVAVVAEAVPVRHSRRFKPTRCGRATSRIYTHVSVERDITMSAEEMRHPTETELARAVPFTHLDAQDERAVIYFDDYATNVLGRDYWRLMRDMKFYVGEREDDVWVYVPAGFLTDGATVPRLMWWLVPPQGRHGMAALVHDYLCERQTLYSKGELIKIDRKQADKIFNEAMKVSQVNTGIRWLMYGAVRLWGIFSKKTGRTVSAGFLAKKFEMEESWRDHPMDNPHLVYGSI